MNEQGQVYHGDTLIAYTVIRSRRRHKTIQIVLDPVRGVVVASPMRTSRAFLHELVERRAPWIAQRMANTLTAAPRREFVNGESLTYLGQHMPLTVDAAPARRITVAFGPAGLHVVIPDGLAGEERRGAVVLALTRWYRRRAEQDVQERVLRWEQAVGRSPKAVLVRDQKRRWGSCGPDGTLRFNWRLMMAPPEVIDYVVVHELCHLHVRSHSRAFWDEVVRLLPDYHERRKLLNHLGPSLVV